MGFVKGEKEPLSSQSDLDGLEGEGQQGVEIYSDDCRG